MVASTPGVSWNSGWPGVLLCSARKFLTSSIDEIVAAQMQPGVEEHRAVAGGEDEAVAVEPARLVGIVDERVAVEDGADFGAAERQAEVAGGGFVDGVHGEAAGLVGSLGEDVGLELHEKW